MQRGNARAQASQAKPGSPAKPAKPLLRIREDDAQRAQALQNRIDASNEHHRERYRRLQISNLRLSWIEKKDKDNREVLRRAEKPMRVEPAGTDEILPLPTTQQLLIIANNDHVTRHVPGDEDLPVDAFGEPSAEQLQDIANNDIATAIDWRNIAAMDVDDFNSPISLMDDF